MVSCLLIEEVYLRQIIEYIKKANLAIRKKILLRELLQKLRNYKKPNYQQQHSQTLERFCGGQIFRAEKYMNETKIVFSNFLAQYPKISSFGNEVNNDHPEMARKDPVHLGVQQVHRIDL